MLLPPKNYLKMFVCLIVPMMQGWGATVTFTNGGGDGSWGNTSNWSPAQLPGAADEAVLSGGLSAGLQANAGSVGTITVGADANPSTLLTIGADVAVGTLRVAQAGGSQGSVVLEGGTLSVSTAIQVGVGGTGTLIVEGNGADSLAGANLQLGAGGTLRFNFSAAGIETLELSGTLTIDSSSSLVVDGSLYDGLDGYIPLVLAGSQAGSFSPAQITLTGFGGREPALITEADGLWLYLTAPPAFSSQFFSLFPESTVSGDYNNTQFSATRAYDPSGSAWGTSQHEGNVMDTRLSQDVLGGGAATANRSWELRVGRGGHIYSLRTPALGETVPPQRHNEDNAPWVDEVWQGVAVSQDLNDPASGSPYFLHQSGLYMKDPIQRKPFYSPQVAAQLDIPNRSYTTINWTPHAHVNLYTDGTTSNNFKSYVLAFTRYKDLGQGLIEVTLGYYNYGPDRISWLNMPWGGVRRSSLEYAFLSKTDETSWNDPIDHFFGNTVFRLSQTGGWVGFSASQTGDSPALGLVFGKDWHIPLEHQARESWYRPGYAGGSYQADETAWRNYLVSSNIRHYNLAECMGVWSRTHFVLGDNLTDVSSRIAARSVVDRELRAFEYDEQNSPLVGYRFSGSGTAFRVLQDDQDASFFLYAYPLLGSYPVFEVLEEDDSRYLTWNPYVRGIVKPYDGRLSGLRLLGFALPPGKTNLAGTSYSYDALATLLSGATGNYEAGGKSLYARRSPEAVSVASIADAGTSYPAANVVSGNSASQASGALIRDDGVGLIAQGQTFTLSEPTLLDKLTIRLAASQSIGAGSHDLLLWIGTYNGSEPGRAAGDASVFARVNLASTSLSSGRYYSIDFDDTAFAPGTYAFQLAWASQDASHQLNLWRASGGGNDPGGGHLSRSGSVSPLRVPFSASPVGGNDLVYALQGSNLYNAWAAGEGLGNTAETADPDSDQRLNLLEYALGGNPTAGGDESRDPLVLTRPTDNQRGLDLVYLRRRDADARGLRYTVETTDSLTSPTWTERNTLEVASGPVDAEFEAVTNSIDISRTQFLRLKVELGATAYSEVLGVVKVPIYEGLNYVAAPFVQDSNIIGNHFGHVLPSGETEALATVLEDWSNSSQSLENRYWHSDAVGFEGWNVNGFNSAEAGPFDASRGYRLILRDGAGDQNLFFYGKVPSAASVSQTIHRNGYSLLTSPYPVAVNLTDTSLVAQGFTGAAVNLMDSDWVLFYNPEQQAFSHLAWYHTATSSWRDINGNAFTRAIQPGEAFLIQRLGRGSDITWTHSRPYAMP